MVSILLSHFFVMLSLFCVFSSSFDSITEKICNNMNGLHVRTRMLKIYDIRFQRIFMYVCSFSNHKSSKNEKISFTLLGKKQKHKTQQRERKKRR